MKVPIYHFYHCCTLNHWDKLLNEHIANLISSGLYDEMEEMYIGCVGDGVEQLKNIISPYPKIKLSDYSPDIKKYEFLTLRLIREKCNNIFHPAYIYYSHSKGSSYGKSTHSYIGGKTWHDYMEYFNCKKYKDAIKVLDFGYDAYGCKVVKKRDSSSHRTHISGNVWWVNSEYFRTLPEIDSLNTDDRFEAEMVIGEHGALLFTPCQLFIDYICSHTFEYLMQNGYVKTLI